MFQFSRPNRNWHVKFLILLCIMTIKAKFFKSIKSTSINELKYNLFGGQKWPCRMEWVHTFCNKRAALILMAA